MSQGLLDAGWESEKVGSRLKTHEFIKNLLLTPEEKVTIDGHLIEGTVSTTNIDNKTFISYIEDIQRIGAQYLNVYIPDPNEVSLLNFD